MVYFKIRFGSSKGTTGQQENENEEEGRPRG
jgi:hypothetical protein